MVQVTVDPVRKPSNAVYVKLVEPEKPRGGRYVIVPEFVNERLPVLVVDTSVKKSISASGSVEGSDTVRICPLFVDIFPVSVQLESERRGASLTQLTTIFTVAGIEIAENSSCTL
jgi:hypothetical protein